ncbi:MAG: 2-polyprenyl-3-methyl-5-hydroxy-6-metoxy-1,4-benzoquinol methylase [Candidatus Omnitrophota bacterium]|jgi:2-polyprenyl-3-methyl-5-hydroxy-6-metoxy-1,4-benzoquinol methylase
MSEAFKVTEHQGIVPSEESAKIVAQHAAAYALAEPSIKDKVVLEIGHGDGYGSARLARLAKHVTAIDLFEENSKKAALKYAKANLVFKAMNACELEFDDQSIDIVCSFQVIEHIPEKQLPAYAQEIKRVLKPGGIAFISTLNLKNNKKPGIFYNKSPHHDKEFEPQEYKEFFANYFDDFKLMGLYPNTSMRVAERLKKSGVFKWIPEVMNPIQKYYANISEHNFQWLEQSQLDQCIDLMAVLKK